MVYKAEDLVAIAVNEIGYHEKVSNNNLDDKTANSGSNNYTKYARDLANAGYYNGNKNGYAWCDVFVDWCFYILCGCNKTKAEELECQTGDLGAGCTYSKQYYKNAGRLDTIPKVGDQIFFISDGTVSHTGIVETVSNSEITTIEGNSSDQVKRNTYKLTNSKIDSFGHPRYDTESSVIGNKTVDELAQEVLDGAWGNGDSRKIALTNAGYDYEAVQNKVNELLKSTNSNLFYPDVSHYHPVANWSKVKSNCAFIISKATQRQDYVDPTLDDFISGCESNKIPYWVFTYLEKGNEKDQAKFMVSTCKDKIGSYFVGYILDVEAGSSASNVQDALNYLVGLGYKTMLYTGYADYSTYKTVIKNRPDSCAWWEARYGKNTGYYNSSYPCHDGVDLHQYTSIGNCPGITGDCDLNRICGNKDETWFKTQNLDKSVSTATTTTTTIIDSTNSKKTSDLLDVDGSIGPKTIKCLQTFLGTTVDGRISGQSNKYKKYWASITSSACLWNGGSSQVVRALQKEIGITVDGLLGHKTAKALQTYLIDKGYSCGSSGVDGEFGINSAKALQNWLNSQQ